MNLAISIIVCFSALWVIYDASKNKLQSPVAWGLSILFLWFIALPVYLFKRKKMIVNATGFHESGVEDNAWHLNKRQTPAWVGYALVIAFSVGYYSWNLSKGELPLCESKEVAEVLSKIVDGDSISNPAQYSYEMFNEVRHCNLMINDTPRSFTVKWYSEDKDQFLVKFD
ncbi:hypothetical protein [Serratia sp. 14-2641]|uniref:hypothetical protein n=1 Tax=Serratia sp. 14-2641 TaxID=1841657 RepID=UPI0008100343|nr:hypothetical protein [Serratia sp. 14-2641]OCJ24589.1 hypothetical protein A6U95_10770 [Serratia sp. 14-2641]